jgi:transposase-like protein
MRATDRLEQGMPPAEIARQVGVSHQIVSDWRAAWRRSGRDGLRGAGRAGRLPTVTRIICRRERQWVHHLSGTVRRQEKLERVTQSDCTPGGVWAPLKKWRSAPGHAKRCLDLGRQFSIWK